MKRLRSVTDRAILRLIAERVSAEQQQQSSDGGAGEKLDLAKAVDRQMAADADD